MQCRFSGLSFITPAECNTRLVQLANITFSSPYTKQFAINRDIAMSLPMYIGNVDGINIVRPYSSDHLQWSATASTAHLGSCWWHRKRLAIEKVSVWRDWSIQSSKLVKSSWDEIEIQSSSTWFLNSKISRISLLLTGVTKILIRWW